ncbi:MAG: hypothetical protein EHM70_15630, partial [Chloroflexota bacterium]
MTLRMKTLLTISAALAGLIAILFIVSQGIISHQITEAEEEGIRQDVTRVTGVLSSFLDGMVATNSDWSSWDDTYQFIEDKDQAYITANINSNTFNTLDLNLMVFVHESGEIVESRAFDLENEIEVPLPEDLLQHLNSDSPLVHHPSPGSTVKGILLLHQGPMLVVSRPILDSMGEGPVRGSFIIGRQLDENVLLQIETITRSGLEISRLDSTGMPADFIDA